MPDKPRMSDKEVAACAALPKQVYYPSLRKLALDHQDLREELKAVLKDLQLYYNFVEPQESLRRPYTATYSRLKYTQDLLKTIRNKYGLDND